MSDNLYKVSFEYLFELEQIDQSGLPLRKKYIQLKQLLELICREITVNESLQFSSLFSRIVFISQKFQIPKSLEWHLQNIRVKSLFLLQNENNLISPSQYQLAKEVLLKFCKFIEGIEDQSDIPDIDEETDIHQIYNKLRVQVIDINSEKETILCHCKELIAEIIEFRYNVHPVNDAFNESIEKLWIGAQLNLIDVKRDESGCFIPKIIVLEPDFLIDASALAECFQTFSTSYLHYFRRKFEPITNSRHILLGNLANFFLDELIFAEEPERLSFHDIFIKSFHHMPFEYASCTDIRNSNDFKEFMLKAQGQFDNIKRVVLSDIPNNGFDISGCTLEPSFFCEKFGLQGRLDLLQLPDENEIYRIIELKSGKTPFPSSDTTKIAPNHEAQTVIYRLMIQSVFDIDSRNIFPTILYSAAENEGDNIRFAAVYQKLEKEIINIRNLIVATEHRLYTGDQDTIKDFFHELLNPDSYGDTPTFFTDKLNHIKEVLDKSTTLEQKYFFRFIQFITNEIYLLKIGDEGYSSYSSISSLWNHSFEERKEAFEVIDNLIIEEIDDSGRDMIIRFSTLENNECSNFREGELCILYPKDNSSDTILTNQILKGNIAKIASDEIVLRFRYKQKNRSLFEKYKLWAIEHDKLDHSYNHMYKHLFSFLASPKRKKNLLLGLDEPEITCNYQTDSSEKENIEKQIIDNALAAKDYYLIVGPPGTGKTSIFARQLIENIHKDENANILVLAYTNKAVDELCEAICSAFKEDNISCDKYIRIGTELSCGAPYRHRLLQNISSNVSSRKELLQEIDHTHIIVGTLASITGKPEILALKHFNVALIDEASQILEPQIISVLTQVDKFIMIGDHKQLSTITLQNENKSKVNDELLNSIELRDCKESLFERLFRICEKNNWHHAYSTLSYHGRMHKDIAAFVNEHFYEGILKTATERQEQKLYYKDYNNTDLYQSLIAAKRLEFISVKGNNKYTNNKINESEADIVTELAQALYKIYQTNNLSFHPDKTLGIITPYRNQIALIRQKLEKVNIPELKDIMVDTVERYQGSQRDVIIISFCFNKHYQMNYFCNMNREGIVDRKLNVALTRAREQLFLIGNNDILSQHPIYKRLLEYISSPQ